MMESFIVVVCSVCYLSLYNTTFKSGAKGIGLEFNSIEWRQMFEFVALMHSFRLLDIIRFPGKIQGFSQTSFTDIFESKSIY